MSSAIKKAVSEMKEAVFEGVKTTPAGDAYAILCQNLPLVPIAGKTQYVYAKEVVTRIAIYLNERRRGSESLTADVRIYMDALTRLIADYERTRFPTVGNASAEEMLAYLMQLYGLKQRDLADDLGGQPVVSAILSGNRKLNLQQVRKLAKRFGVPAAVFV